MARPTAGFVCLAACILVSILTVGCGVGANVYPTASASVAATQNPLVAQYNVTVPQKGATVWVEFGPDKNYGTRTSLSVVTTSFTELVPVFVAGMLPGKTYHMRAHINAFDGSETWVDQDQTFTTGPIPIGTLVGNGTAPLNAPTLTVTSPGTPQPGLELFSLIAPNTTHTLEAIVSDLSGNIVWYYDVGAGLFPFPIKPLPNGHFLVNVAPGLTGGSVLREVDLAGNTVREMSSDALTAKLAAFGSSIVLLQLHHDFALLPNGHTVLLGNTVVPFTNLPGYPGTTYVTGDVLIDVDQNWNPVWVWSTFDHLDVNRHLEGLPDWTHGNAILYTADGNLLLSLRHQSWLLKIDYNNGKGSGDILWKLGEDGDFNLAGGDPSDWFYAQHAPQIISTNGSQMTFALFDNGNYRITDSQGDNCGSGNTCYSRAAIFQIDQDSRTANVQWQYKPGFFSFWGGNSTLLPNNNVEFDMSAPYSFATTSLVTEVTQDSNPDTVWQLRVDGANAYRAYRIPGLYPNSSWQK